MFAIYQYAHPRYFPPFLFMMRKYLGNGFLVPFFLFLLMSHDRRFLDILAKIRFLKFSNQYLNIRENVWSLVVIKK